MRRFSADVIAKAETIVGQHRVERFIANVWHVDGNHGTYVVGVNPDPPVEDATCSCPHGQARAEADKPAYCSHVAAVLLHARGAAR